MLRKLGASLAVLAMSVALLGLGLPASAGHQISVDADGVTVADNTGDSKDSPSCLIDDRQQDPFIPRPPTNVVVGNCDQPVPQLDVQSFSFKHKDGLLKDPAGNDGIYGTADDAIGLDQVPGTADDTPAANITRTVPGLEATWTVGKAWPALGVLKATPDREGDQPLDGLTVYTYWRVAELNRNILYPLCERNTSTDVKKTYLLSYGGHEVDGYFFTISVDVTFAGGRYEGAADLGFFDPNQDGFLFQEDIKNNALYNPYNTATVKRTGKGHFYDWSVSGTTITAKMPGVYVERSSTCKAYKTGAAFGFALSPYGRTAAQKAGAIFQGNLQNDQIRHVSFQSFLLQQPRLPVVIPFSAIPLLGLEDSDWIIGFLDTQDDLTLHAVEQRIGGYTSKNLMTSTWAGPTCPTPTFGGTLPPNPLWVANQGNPCALDSPVGDEWFPTGINFSV